MNQFPDDTPVEVKYPLTPEQEKGDRSEWPWLPGTVVQQVGPDEWVIDLDDIDATCFRDSSEVRLPGGAR